MAFSTLSTDATWESRAAADVIYPAVFVYVDWPSSTIRASTHTASVTIDGDVWAGVGNAGTIESASAQQSGAAQRWTVGFKGIPTTPVALQTQIDAVGVDAAIYLGLFDSDWSDPVLKATFTGFANGRRTQVRPSEDGVIADVMLELSDMTNPRRAVADHWAVGGNGDDTAQRLLHTVGRAIQWP